MAEKFDIILKDVTELLSKINALDIGPQGLGGDTTAIGVETARLRWDFRQFRARKST